MPRLHGLTQRLHCTLREAGHDVTVELDIADAVTDEAAALADPDLVIAPFLKRAHSGIGMVGAAPAWWCTPARPVTEGRRRSTGRCCAATTKAGVTVLQATGEFDAGPVWAFRRFPDPQRCRARRACTATR